ncbi:uncharacterized protein METZ01_LOCUS467205, partial [marine metagenome]
MKLVLFGDDYKLGVLQGENVIDVSQITQDIRYFSPQEMMNIIIGNFDKYRSQIEAITSNGGGTPRSQLRLRAPLPEPPRLV